MAMPPAMQPDPAMAVSIRGLFKRFGDKVAVNGLSLDIPTGSFYGLVGPNGAGKTTTTLNLGAGLVKRGKRVLFVDMDPQCSLSYIMGGDCSGNIASTRELLMNPQMDPTIAVQHLKEGDLICANPCSCGRQNLRYRPVTPSWTRLCARWASIPPWRTPPGTRSAHS